LPWASNNGVPGASNSAGFITITRPRQYQELLMTEEVRRWYPSKIDWWLVPLLCAPPLAAIAICIQCALAGDTRGLMIGIASLLFVAGLYFGLVFPMRYGLGDTHLVVRSGFLRQRIPLADISEVRPTFNPLSSPALSLNRLRVQFGQGFFRGVMISPADRNCFLDELVEKTGLHREGDRLFQ
jgi:hypothetical protein